MAFCAIDAKTVDRQLNIEFPINNTKSILKGISGNKKNHIRDVGNVHAEDKRRPVLGKSSVVITSYPGADELGGHLDPEHEYWLSFWSTRKHQFANIPRVKWENVAEIINNMSSEEVQDVRGSPTEEDWLRYCEEEIAQQKKIKDVSQQKNLSPDVPVPKTYEKFAPKKGSLGDAENKKIASKISKQIDKKTGILAKVQNNLESHLLEGNYVDDSPYSSNSFPSTSAANDSFEITDAPTDCDSFDLQTKVFDFVDEFPDDLPLITSEDISQLGCRTLLLKAPTPEESKEVEEWLRS